MEHQFIVYFIIYQKFLFLAYFRKLISIILFFRLNVKSLER